MSQFNFTAEEDALVVSALGVLSDVQRASQGRAADDVVALLAKIAQQQAPAVVVDEKPAKVKKTKADEVAEEAPAAE